jgi:hypothetical protein
MCEEFYLKVGEKEKCKYLSSHWRCVLPVCSSKWQQASTHFVHSNCYILEKYDFHYCFFQQDFKVFVCFTCF